MFIYNVVMTIGLTWIILIQPNHYSLRSNAFDWIVGMSVFVFLPMLLSYWSSYMDDLEKRRKATRHSSRNRVYETEGSDISDIFDESFNDEAIIQYTPGYNRARFQPSVLNHNQHIRKHSHKAA